MNKLNLDKVKEMTNNKIGYDSFMEEEHSRNKRIKKTVLSLSIVMFMFISLVSVNALTDNGIIKLFTGKATINGEEKDVKSYIQIYYTGEPDPNDLKAVINKKAHNELCVESEEAKMKVCFTDAKEILKVEMNYDKKLNHPTDYTITYIDINDQVQVEHIDSE